MRYVSFNTQGNNIFIIIKTVEPSKRKGQTADAKQVKTFLILYFSVALCLWVSLTHSVSSVSLSRSFSVSVSLSC